MVKKKKKKKLRRIGDEGESLGREAKFMSEALAQ